MLISIAVSASAQAGDINIETPLVSGDVAKFDIGKETSPRELSRGQLQALSLWLELHRSNWHGMSTEGSSEPRSLQLNLKDKEGKAVSIGVIAGADGRHYLCLISSDKWSYRSFGGLLKSRAAARPVSDRELVVLQKILGTT
jgi:hypothetical protein